MAKVKPFKVYDLKNIEASIYSGQFECVEYLKDKFKKQPKEFHARWHCQNKTTEEYKAREKAVLSVGRRTLEMAAFHARTVNRDPGPTVEDWKAAAKLAAKARDTLWSFLNSFEPAPPHPFEAAASPEAFAEVFRMSWLKMLVEKTEGEGRAADLQALIGQAHTNVQMLIDAVVELDGFAQVIGSRYRHLKVARSNPGKPQKVRFAVEMMRGWVFLFGGTPKVGDETFAHFLSLAWSDICESAADEPWDTAIKEARKELRPEVTKLSQSGPQWL